MDRIESIIASFGGHQYRDCYKDLYQAISIEKEYLPQTPKMQELVGVISASSRTKKRQPRTIWRSLARAIEDLWDYGDKAVLMSYHRSWTRYRPKPQEFIETIARFLREEEQNGENTSYGES